MSPFAAADDLNDRVALQLDGVLFIESEGGPAEITAMIRALGTLADDASATGEWLGAAMSASWEMAGSLADLDELAPVLGERHRIIANDWQAASMSVIAGTVLHRAAEVLERIDFTPAALRDDLAGDRTAGARLYAAAELIGHAADLYSDSAGIVHDNEPRWRAFRRHVVEGSPGDG